MSLEDIERRLQVLEDIEAIKKLKARYCAYCDDDYNPDGIAGLFVEDGVWDGGSRGRFVGQDELRRFAAGAVKRFSFALHFVLNPIITVHGDEAHGSWYLFMTGTLRDSNQAIWSALRYEDEYVRVDGEWKYRSLRVADSYFTTPFDQGWAKQQFVPM